MGSNALQVVVVGQSSGASGRATSATGGPIRSPIGPQPVEVEPVEGGRRRLHHGAHLGLGVVGEGDPERLGRVRVAALGVRVVRPPHDVLDPEVAAERRLARAQEAGADPEVAGEVLRRGHRHLGRGGTEEVRLGRVGRRHAAVEPVERLQAPGQPGHALLGDGEAQRRVALEHPGEDEVPDRAVAEPGDLDQHHGPRRLVLPVVGQRAAPVDVDRARRARRTPATAARSGPPTAAAGGSWAGWTAAGCRRRGRRWRRPSAPRRRRPPCRWRRPARCRPGGPAWPRRSRPASGCGPGRRPSAARSPRATGAGRPGSPRRRRAGPCWGRAPRPRCRRTRSRPGAARCPSCGRRWAR